MAEVFAGGAARDLPGCSVCELCVPEAVFARMMQIEGERHAQVARSCRGCTCLVFAVVLACMLML